MSFAPDCRFVHAVHPAANHEPRGQGQRPSLLILHYTGMVSATKAIDWLASAESRVSCHYVVDDEGRITQMVAEDRRAWHAGVSFWAGECDINSASIGIEIQNPGYTPDFAMSTPDFTRPQMTAVLALSQDIVARHGIRPERVLAHSDVAPCRKIDPGEKFDWQGLALAGVGHWVAPHAVDPADPGLEPGSTDPALMDAQTLLQRYGYEIVPSGMADAQTGFVLRAFQLHFRPARVDGRLDRSTLMTLERLVAALPTPLIS